MAGISMSLLDTAKDCSRKAVLYQNFSGEKGKYYVLKKVIDNVIGKIEFEGKGTTEAELIDLIDKAFEDAGEKGFANDFEVQSHKRILKDQIMRYVEWGVAQKVKIINRGLKKEVTIGGQKLTIRAHLLLERNGYYEVVVIDRRNPQYSMTGKKTYRTSLEMYGLNLLAKEVEGELEAKKSLNGKAVIPSIHYLKSRADKTNAFSVYFDSRAGDNITTGKMSDDEMAEMEAKSATVVMDIKSRKDADECASCQYNLTCNGNFQKRVLTKEKPKEEELSVVKLTKGQLEMVMSQKGVFRINAVAGSGKTTVVALRTLSLVEGGCDPEKILMITFTDKAREEMKKKIKGFAKAYYGSRIDLKGLAIETFNSWGHRIICTHYKDLGFTKEPTVIDDWTKRDIIVGLLDSYRSFPLNYANPFMDLPYTKGAVIEMGNILDRIKANDARTKEKVASLMDSHAGWTPAMCEHLLAFYLEYNKEIVKRNVLDYSDQLRLLEDLKSKKVFEGLPYEHIIIDEFQDSDPNQLRIIEEVMRVNKDVQSLAVVGDMMQSIYSFRNTSPENLINFGTRFPDVRDINLTENFRSQSGITDMANRILDVESKTSARILSQRAFIKEPIVRAYDKREEEIHCMKQTVKRWIKGKVQPKDIAVLGRTRSELLKYQEVLEGEGIPTVLKVPEIIRENIYVQAVFALAGYLRNDENTGALALYLKSLGKNPFDFAEINAVAEDIKNTMAVLPDEKARVEEFYSRVKHAEEADYLAAEFIDTIRHKGLPTLGAIVEYLTKYDLYQVKDGFSKSAAQVDAVTLITVHSAKGLEYKNVVLMTSKFKDNVNNTNTEEKRLLYVGVTRAKDALTVILPSKQRNFIDLIRRKKA